MQAFSCSKLCGVSWDWLAPKYRGPKPPRAVTGNQEKGHPRSGCPWSLDIFSGTDRTDSSTVSQSWLTFAGAHLFCWEKVSRLASRAYGLSSPLCPRECNLAAMPRATKLKTKRPLRRAASENLIQRTICGGARPASLARRRGGGQPRSARARTRR